MARTVTSTPNDLTLSAGFNTTKSGTISWTAPTVPDGATIKSCVLTGKATASSTNVTSIKINDEPITVSTSGYNFTIDLGKDNSITSVTATMTKKSGWQTHNVKFTNMTYTVTYELASVSVSYTVTFKDWDGSVLKTQTVASGGSATPPSNPTRDGYRFTGWSGSYTNITADTDITAQYIKLYSIVASAGTGGTISPDGTTTVDEGSSQSYTISANTRYRVKSVTIDGVDQGAITSYTFSNVTSDHTIAVVFETIPTYTITASVNTGGSITPSGTTTVLEGDSQTYNISANDGYAISDVKVDNISQGIITTYTFSNITTNHTIKVIFAPTISEIFTPTSIDLDISNYLEESSPFSNALGKGSDNEGDYAEWSLVTGGAVKTYTCWTFDLSSIPSNATITNVTCSARCSNTNANIAQAGNTTVAIGVTDGSAYVNKQDSSTPAFGTEPTVVTVSSANYTREELDNFRLKIQAARGFINTDTSYHTKFYGATLTIEYIIPDDMGTYNLKIGDSSVNSIYIGDTKVVKVYLGDTLIFEN